MSVNVAAGLRVWPLNNAECKNSVYRKHTAIKKGGGGGGWRTLSSEQSVSTNKYKT